MVKGRLQRGLHCATFEGLMTQAGGWRLELKKVFFSKFILHPVLEKKMFEENFPIKGLEKNDLAKKWKLSWINQSKATLILILHSGGMGIWDLVTW